MGSDHRLLLVGAGSRVRDVLLPALEKAALPMRLAGAVDPDPGVTESLARFDPIPVYSSLEEALGTVTFDTAILACPHDRHQSLTLRLLDAGVTVWKEKPFALTTRDAVELARRSGRLRVLAHRPHSQLYTIASRLAADWGRILSYRIRISRDELQPGDLLFYDTGGPGPPPAHVTMYVGEGNMANAPRTGEDVRVEPVTSEYYSERFMGAVRPN